MKAILDTDNVHQPLDEQINLGLVNALAGVVRKVTGVEVSVALQDELDNWGRSTVVSITDDPSGIVELFFGGSVNLQNLSNAILHYSIACESAGINPDIDVQPASTCVELSDELRRSTTEINRFNEIADAFLVPAGNKRNKI